MNRIAPSRKLSKKDVDHLVALRRYFHRHPRRPDWDPVPLHSPLFDIDEDVLSIGAAFYDQVAREAIKAGGRR